MFRKWLLLLLLVTASLLLLLRCSTQPEVTEPLPSTALTVELVKPQVRIWPETLVVQGAISAWQEAIISSEISGLSIIQLDVDVGSAVTKGQTLAQLNDQGIQTELAAATAQLDKAKANLAEAAANASRATSLHGNKALSEQQLEQFALAVQIAEADVRSAEAALQSCRVKLTQSRIVAMDDGVISSRSASLGEVVSTGQEMFRLIRQHKVEWHASLDSSQLQRVQPGMIAKLRLQDGIELQGAVRQISPTLHPQSQLSIAYITIPTHPAAKPGLFTQGEIVLGERQVLSLPASALSWRDGRSVVFTLQGNSVQQRQVITGRTLANHIEIVSGLEEETVVILSGGAFLNNGDLVTVAPAETLIAQQAVNSK